MINNHSLNISPYNLFKSKSYRSIEEFFEEDTTKYDVFISAYTKEDIVTKTFDMFNATKKYWLIFPEYHFQKDDISSLDNYFNVEIGFDAEWEIEYILEFLKYAKLTPEMSICIDISGFIKPYMIFLLPYLKHLKFTNIDIIYSEPKAYKESSNTEFAQKDILINRNIMMIDQEYFEPSSDDLFIVNAGYDSRLVKSVLQDIQVNETTVLIGYPALQPIMYQENLINIEKAQTSLKIDHTLEPLTAPANNPFETAKVISNYIHAYLKIHSNIRNIYIASLATKAQALGSLIFYMCENTFFTNAGISIHFRYPFTSHYSSQSSIGIFRINKYSLEYDKMREWFAE